MMAAFRYLLSACLVVVVCTAVSAQDPVDWDALKGVSHSNLDFSRSLYKLQSRKEGNVFFSPASIHTILALTSMGARGSTAQQMSQGLYLPHDQQKTKNGFRNFMESIYDTGKSVTMKIANRIFTDSRYPPIEEFSRVAETDFYSSSEPIDFKHKYEDARGKINAWVEENTEGKITNLLPGGSVDSNTTMVLVNALYFKGAWDSPFVAVNTTSKPFYASEKNIKDVPMMYKYVEGKFPYYDSKLLNADILEIPYKDKKVSMVVILPKEKNGLKDVEARLAGVSLRNITSAQPSYPHVHLSLPKFKLEVSSDLKEDLTLMGMEQMFTDKADFSGLTDSPISISKIVYKAFIEVDENGTQAAAATVGSSTKMKQVSPQEITFKADHSFIFMLVKETPGIDNLSKDRTVLFMGRFYAPS